MISSTPSYIANFHLNTILLYERDVLTKIEGTTRYLNGYEFNIIDSEIVLRTGLGSFLNSIDVTKLISYQEIPNFPDSTVEFHKGNLVLGNIEKILKKRGI